jgi:predicted LPLAT superfamily acyltransferase
MTRPHWIQQPERGSRVLLRIMLWITLHMGWPIARGLLGLIALYYFLTSGRARAASREFLSRALDRPATPWDEFRHIFVFASVILESVYLLAGRIERFDITIEGLEGLTTTLAGGHGCILLGAHLGSFEVLRAIGRKAPVAVRPVMYRRNAKVITLLETLDPSLAASVIELGAPGAMLQVKEALARGEIVGMLADRALGEEKVIEAPFLGRPAAFPAGPLMVAASLDVPILLFFGIRTGPRRYAVQFENFADRLVAGRATRLSDLSPWVARFAARLEIRCRAHPYNWFNFYPFWQRT